MIQKATRFEGSQPLSLQQDCEDFILQIRCTERTDLTSPDHMSAARHLSFFSLLMLQPLVELLGAEALRGGALSHSTKSALQLHVLLTCFHCVRLKDFYHRKQVGKYQKCWCFVRSVLLASPFLFFVRSCTYM